MKIPLVSIIVPCFNQAQYLDQALQSVLSQTYSNWECVIVNDGSPDNIEEVAKNWLEKDKRFKYLFQENKGLSNARNLGISQSSGEYILPLDADNQLIHDFIQDAITVFEKNQEIGVVHGDAEYFGLKSGIWKIGKYNLERMLIDNYIDACAIYKKIYWEKAGGYDENLPHNGLEDWELWLAFGRLKVIFFHLGKITFKYYVATNSMIKSFNNEKAMDTRDYVLKKYSKEYRYYFCKLYSENNTFSVKLKNKKFVIDIFCKTFFGFSIFKKL